MDSAINSAPLPMLAFCSQVSPLKVSSGRPSNNELSNWSTSCLRKCDTQNETKLGGSGWNWWSGNWNWWPLFRCWSISQIPEINLIYKTHVTFTEERPALHGFAFGKLSTPTTLHLEKKSPFFSFWNQIWNSQNTYEFDLFWKIPESLPNWKQSRSESDGCVMCDFTKKKLSDV